jgi:single-strand DNA-binding protein
MYLNKIILIGRIGKDPDVRKLDDGTFASFSLATTGSYKNKAGERIENTTWHNIKCFGKQAEFVEKYVTKGLMIVIEGSYLSEKYETKSGEKRTSYFVKPSDIKFGDNPKEKHQEKEVAKVNDFEIVDEVNDDDSPF